MAKMDVEEAEDGVMGEGVDTVEHQKLEDAVEADTEEEAEGAEVVNNPAIYPRLYQR